MPGESGVTVVTMLVCFIYFAREAAGALSARHSPRPLFFLGERFMHNSGAFAPRDCGHVSGFYVIARSDLSAVAQRAKAKATKQSSLRHSGMVRRTRAGISRFRVRCGACHRAALGADPLASTRNDGLKTACGLAV